MVNNDYVLKMPLNLLIKVTAMIFYTYLQLLAKRICPKVCSHKKCIIRVKSYLHTAASNFVWIFILLDFRIIQNVVLVLAFG